MMNNKMKYVIGILLVLFSIGSIHSQEIKKTCQSKDNDSIVMPKDEFIDVVAKAVMARRKKNAQMETSRYRAEVLKRKLQQKGKATNTHYLQKAEAEKDYDYDRRFNRLEDQLQALMIMIATRNNIPGTSGNSGNYLPNTNDNNENYLKLLDNVNKLRDTSVVNVDNSALEQEINRLVAETERLKDKIHFNQPTELQKSQYDGQTSEVFFANAKYNLSNEAITTIDKVVALLKNDAQLDVMVKGFASKVGNSLYNQNLSLKRSDNVKQAIISKGIAPGRVLTTYHGEDFSNRSEAESRRVDIIILDRRK